MAVLTKPDFLNKYNSTLIGLFKDNVTNDIEEVDLRELVIDLCDSFLGISAGISFTESTPSTAGGTITIDAASATLGTFIGSASFATAKAVALTNDTNLRKFDFIFEVTDIAGTLDFGAGSNFKCGDYRWTAASQVFTAAEIGIYKVHAVLAGSNWYLDFSPLPYN